MCLIAVSHIRNGIRKPHVSFSQCIQTSVERRIETRNFQSTHVHLEKHAIGPLRAYE